MPLAGWTCSKAGCVSLLVLIGCITIASVKGCICLGWPHLQSHTLSESLPLASMCKRLSQLACCWYCNTAHQVKTWCCALSELGWCSACCVFIMDTRSCGLGTSLPSIDLVIIHDSEWNQHGDLQAIGRARCLGQASPEKPASQQPEILRLLVQVPGLGSSARAQAGAPTACAGADADQAGTDVCTDAGHC